jgi:uncharacterized protein YndB with AHSA1/START domain
MSKAETRTLVIEREMSHPPEKVWRALTQGPLIEEWLMPNDFQPVAGHRFNFRIATPMPNWSGVVDCQVLLVEPNKTLSYTWTSGEGAFRIESVVTFTLRPTPRGVLLRMEQSGFRAEQVRNCQGATYGWERFLGSLEQVLARLE